MTSHPHDPSRSLIRDKRRSVYIPTVGVNALGVVRGDLTRGIAVEDCIKINNNMPIFLI